MTSDPAANPAAVILELEAEARVRAAGLGLTALAARVRVRWHARLRTTAGLAVWRESLVLLNPRLLAFAGEARRTMLHELAHLAARERHPRRRLAPHGSEWRDACRDLGLADEARCHRLSLAAPRRVQRRHRYHCPCCRLEVARVRPLRRREACLRCCRAHAGGRYDGRFRLLPGPPPAPPRDTLQPELFRL
jgi:predicted SprT family Zn-dependent metalloprotease